MDAEANTIKMILTAKAVPSNKSGLRPAAFPATTSLHDSIMQALVEDFLQYLRHERGQSDNTARTYAALLGRFVAWAEKQGLADWQDVELKHLMAFLSHERMRGLLPAGRTS